MHRRISLWMLSGALALGGVAVYGERQARTAETAALEASVRASASGSLFVDAFDGEALNLQLAHLDSRRQAQARATQAHEVASGFAALALALVALAWVTSDLERLSSTDSRLPTAPAAPLVTA